MGFYGEVAVVALVVLVPIWIFAALAFRRALLARTAGMVEMSLRLRSRSHGRGWVLGTGRYVGDELQWFRVFSLALSPRRRISRSDFSIVRRREPSRPEKMTLQPRMIILECQTTTGPVQLAMGQQALTGFLSWLESAAPGASLPG
ncbi:MAG: DUF2550 domain-containing protein [Actinomycetota bacterium]|nr:DUF2550 domain-containing protein [Actinomycetota bacterium]